MFKKYFSSTILDDSLELERDDPIKLYMRQAVSMPLMTKGEEIKIAGKIEFLSNSITKSLFKISFCLDWFNKQFLILKSNIIKAKSILSLNKYIKHYNKSNCIEKNNYVVGDSGYTDHCNHNNFKNSDSKENFNNKKKKRNIFFNIQNLIDNVIEPALKKANQLATNKDYDASSIIFISDIKIHYSVIITLVDMIKLFKKDFNFSIVSKEEIDNVLNIYNDLNIVKGSMMKANLRLVVAQAKTFFKVSGCLSLMDFIQEGNQGLWEAIHGFDEDMGCKFSTFATFWIRQRMMRALSEQSDIVRVPSHMKEGTTKVFKYINNVMQNRRGKKMDNNNFHEEVSIKNISENLNMSEGKVSKVLHANKASVSFDKNIGNDDDNKLIEILEDDTIASPEEIVENNNYKNIIDRLMNENLNNREKEIINLRYGRDCTLKPKTLEEIGKILNITRERVRQIETVALQKLRFSNLGKSVVSFFSLKKNFCKKKSLDKKS